MKQCGINTRFWLVGRCSALPLAARGRSIVKPTHAPQSFLFGLNQGRRLEGRDRRIPHPSPCANLIRFVPNFHSLQDGEIHCISSGGYHRHGLFSLLQPGWGPLPTEQQGESLSLYLFSCPLKFSTKARKIKFVFQWNLPYSLASTTGKPVFFTK